MSDAPILPRRVRGIATETKKKLVEVAAQVFELHGYFGTDTNRIAIAAGYAPGTFYKHFPDKKAIFLAVYDEWVNVEWEGIARLAADGTADIPALATAIVALLVTHHRAWRGFRASLRVLVLQDVAVQTFHRNKRAAQLETLMGLSLVPVTLNRRRQAALLMLIAERVCDAIADEEIASLSLSEEDARGYLAAEVASYLT